MARKRGGPSPGTITTKKRVRRVHVPSLPHWRAARAAVNTLLRSSGDDPIRVEARDEAALVFGRLTRLVLLAGDPKAPEATRKAALSLLRRARRALSPRGRPPRVDPEDLERDKDEAAVLVDEFRALMQDLAGGHRLDAGSASEAATTIKEARRQAVGGRGGELDVVSRLAPRFLGAPLRLTPGGMNRVLGRLAQVRRPTRKGLLTTVLAAKYDVDEERVRAILHPASRSGAQKSVKAAPSSPTAGRR